MSTRAERLAFHRLSTVRPRNRWWTPLLAGVVSAVIYVAFVLILALSLSGTRVHSLLISGEIDPADPYGLNEPASFALTVGFIILMLPAALLGSRIVQGRGVDLLWSVAGRIRWRWLGQMLVLATAVMLVLLVVQVVTSLAAGERLDVKLDRPGIGWTLVLIVLLIPFQATAEEYVFRGYLMQLVGRWLRHPAFAILLPVPIFVLAHTYDFWGSVAVGVFAALMAWLTWRTGGLEAAIALHTMNNLSGMLLPALGLGHASATAVSPLEAVTTIAFDAVFTVLALLWAKRTGLSRTRSIDPVERGKDRLPEQPGPVLAAEPHVGNPGSPSGS